MKKTKKTLIIAGLVTAWPVLSFAAGDPNQFTVPTDDNGIIGTMMRSILLIIVLGGIAIYLSKKFMPKIRPTSGRDINIRETIHLGPQKTVQLIEVGDKTFLIGSTSEHITLLADVTETLSDAQEEVSI